jgi:hypothetical protein
VKKSFCKFHQLEYSIWACNPATHCFKQDKWQPWIHDGGLKSMRDMLDRCRLGERKGKIWTTYKLLGKKRFMRPHRVNVYMAPFYPHMQLMDSWLSPSRDRSIFFLSVPNAPTHRYNLARLKTRSAGGEMRWGIANGNRISSAIMMSSYVYARFISPNQLDIQAFWVTTCSKIQIKIGKTQVICTD